MRILQVHNRYLEPGGEDASVEIEARLLRAAGHEVRQLTDRNPAGRVAAATAFAAAPWNPRSEARARREIRAWRPDVAHVHNTWYRLTPSVIRALARERVPVVMTLRNYRLFCANAELYRNGHVCTDCLGKHPGPGVVHRCYRGSALQSAVAATAISVGRAARVWNDVDCFITSSESVRRVAIQGGLPAAKLRVAPNVTEDPGIRTSSPSASRTVIYAGRLEPNKGVDRLVAAWKSIPEVLDGLELVLIGSGSLEERVKAEGVNGIRHVPWRDRDAVRQRLLGARAVVCPSQWEEPFGRIVIEGFAAGLPALVSNHGGLPELAGPLGREWVAADDDPAAWASALAVLASDDQVDAAGARARALYDSRYSPSAAQKRLTEIYESVRR